MGRLIKGQWHVEEVNPKTKDGAYVRQDQAFRQTIAPGSEFPPEPDRYHLYVSYACPWAHRSLIMRQLKGLEDMISLSVVSPEMLQDGWTFEMNFPGVKEDPVFRAKLLREIYVQVDPEFSGRVTVPVLLDKKQKTIVNNESADIIRIMNSAFSALTGDQEDYYPETLREEIDSINDDVYHHINNGVYKAGFARTQGAYERGVTSLFQALDRLEQRLEGREFLVGERLTEADIRLFTTLVRFDLVYYTHFKCNLRALRDYKNILRYVSGLYERPAFRSTTHFDHIKRHYYYSHETLNPFRIVPCGPLDLGFTQTPL